MVASPTLDLAAPHTAWAAASEAGRAGTNNDRWTAGDALFAIADGAGRSDRAGIAADLALTVVQSIWECLPNSRKALQSAVQTADATVRAAGSGENRPPFLSTLTAICPTPGGALIAHVGDSAAYLIRNGVAERLTLDHSMRSVGAPHLATRLLGQADPPAIDLFTVTLEPGDRLVLASDGIAGHASDAAIASVAERTFNCEPAAQRLLRAARSMGSTDDRTALVIDRLEASRVAGAPRETIDNGRSVRTRSCQS